MQEITTAIGLMSGTSLDGIDVAVLRTDGDKFSEPLYNRTFPYKEETRALLKECLGLRDELDPRLRMAERAMTMEHAEACKEALAKYQDISVIGFHGQTIWHAPEERATRQLGDGGLLADLTRKPVVYTFRQNDMNAGGQGAPLLPLYHAARSAALPRPVAVLNIGGVANVTWIGEMPGEIVSFDTGPGNALLNDWMERHTGKAMDESGETAAKGKTDRAWVQKYLSFSYLQKPPPKALDRQDFALDAIGLDWSLEDGAATLTSFTVACIAASQRWMPRPPKIWLVAGGGRHNKTMMDELQMALNVKVAPVEQVRWNGDGLEAEGFAYLAVRSMRKLPITLPQTTGCKIPTHGGVVVWPR